MANKTTGEYLEQARKSVKEADIAWNHKANASEVLKKAYDARANLAWAIALLEAHCGD